MPAPMPSFGPGLVPEVFSARGIAHRSGARWLSDTLPGPFTFCGLRRRRLILYLLAPNGPNIPVRGALDATRNTAGCRDVVCGREW